jgi:hypothetical protein
VLVFGSESAVLSAQAEGLGNDDASNHPALKGPFTVAPNPVQCITKKSRRLYNVCLVNGPFRTGLVLATNPQAFGLG